jgi:hypothetical protein
MGRLWNVYTECPIKMNRLWNVYTECPVKMDRLCNVHTECPVKKGHLCNVYTECPVKMDGLWCVRFIWGLSTAEPTVCLLQHRSHCVIAWQVIIMQGHGGYYFSTVWSRDNSVSRVTGLQVGRPGFDSRQGQRHFSLRHRIQNGSGTHPTSYPIGTGGSFPGDKAAGAWSWLFTISWQG